MAEYYNGKTIDPDEKGKFLKIEGERYPFKVEGGECFYDHEHDYDESKKAFCNGLSAKSPIDLGIKIASKHPSNKKLQKIRSQHIEELNKGVKSWNQWRNQNPDIRPILYGLNKKKKDELKIKKLKNVNFSNANLIEADLSNTDLTNANFHEANLGGAKLLCATLKRANFCRTDLYKTDLSGADLTKANLQGAQIAGTKFNDVNGKKTNIVNCKVYGCSVWDIEGLSEASQKDLEIVYKLIGEKDYTQLSVDNLAMAQFLYFILNNKNLPDVFKVTNSSIILILGRFTEERKKVLDKIRKCLRDRPTKKVYVPIIFDFKKPEYKGYTEVISVLAGISRFIIADLTNPSSLPQELQAIVSGFRVPIIPIIHRPKNIPVTNIISLSKRPFGDKSKTGPYSMFVDFYKYKWIHPIIEYASEDELFHHFNKLIHSAENFHKKIIEKGDGRLEMISIDKLISG